MKNEKIKNPALEQKKFYFWLNHKCNETAIARKKEQNVSQIGQQEIWWLTINSLY
jgi:hypothetical protein